MAVSGAVMQVLYEEDLDISEQPEVSFIGQLSPVEWKALHQQVQTRIRMTNENSQAIVKSGSEALPSCEILNFSHR